AREPASVRGHGALIASPVLIPIPVMCHVFGQRADPRDLLRGQPLLPLLDQRLRIPARALELANLAVERVLLRAPLLDLSLHPRREVEVQLFEERAEAGERIATQILMADRDPARM